MRRWKQAGINNQYSRERTPSTGSGPKRAGWGEGGMGPEPNLLKGEVDKVWKHFRKWTGICTWEGWESQREAHGCLTGLGSQCTAILSTVTATLSTL